MQGRYTNVNIPDSKDPEDYTYTERRAELLEFIIKAGHPDLISRKKFAERYDVSASQITKDINDHLIPEIRDELTSDAEFITNVVFRKAVREKVRDSDWMEAADLLETWNSWLFDVGAQDQSADKLELDVDAGDAYMDLLKQQADEPEDDA